MEGMNEQFLYYLWRYQRFNKVELHTQQGTPLKIIHPGIRNEDAGPDFFNARIVIADTEWAGNVEMHLKSSDWNVHGHQHDQNYDSVILHVVWESDQEIRRRNGVLIQELELSGITDPLLLDRIQGMLLNQDWVPCAKQLRSVNENIKNRTLDQMLLDRLQDKADRIKLWLEQNKNDWESTFYMALARNFGFLVNAQPFEMLARSLPLAILGKHKDNLLQIEALLFGQAGLLEPDLNDDYFRALKREYVHLKRKFQLKPLPKHLWKYLRLRPYNFPNIRIAQFAQLIHSSNHLFSRLVRTTDVHQIQSVFQLTASDYWSTHYRFGKLSSSRHSKQMGQASIHNLLINTLAPFLFLYGEYKGEVMFQHRAVLLLESLPAERNRYTRSWEKIQWRAKTALQSQALLQLKKAQCEQKNCLNCAIGIELLR